jgi:S1-C subfamily serine protease
MLKKLGRLLGILFVVALVMSLFSMYVIQLNVNDILNYKLSIIGKQQEVSIQYQTDLYNQIAEAIAREKEMYTNFTEANGNIKKEMDIRLAEVNKNIPKELDSLKGYVDKQFAEGKLKDAIAKLNQKSIETKIMQCTIMIVNDTLGAMGSGVTIKYNDEYYILSAGHLIENETDEIYLEENGNRIGKLEVVKVNYDMDLLLVRPVDKKLIPSVYTTLSSAEPAIADILYLCGNPAGVEDLLSEGRAVKYEKGYMYVQDHCWHGSSGGGAFNKQGELVGIISHLRSVVNSPTEPIFALDGTVRLDAIMQFLNPVNPAK